MFYQQLPGTNAGDSSAYDPLYAFGAGLSYTTYETKSVTASGSGTVKVTVNVANTGSRDGDLVVPVYAEPPANTGPLQPPSRLVAFTRVALKAGASKSVALSFPASRLAVTGGDLFGAGKRAVVPGTYKITSGGKSATLPIR